MDNKTTTKAILCSFLGLISFIVMEALAAAILAGIVYIILELGFERIGAWVARFAAPDSFLIPIFGLFFAYWIISLICKQPEQKKLCTTLLGAYLLLIAVVGLIVNLIFGGSIWINLTTGASGLLLLFNKLDSFMN